MNEIFTANFGVSTLSAAPTPDFNEKIVGGKVYWGEKNDFPQHILSMYDKCSTFQSIIEGTSDYISGNGLTDISPQIGSIATRMNDDGESLRQIIDKVGWNNELFGGCFILVTRTDDLAHLGGVQVLDTRRCRCMSDNLGIIYLDVKAGKIQSNGQYYPLFSGWDNPAEAQQQEVYFWRGRRPRGFYPVPRYVSALQAIDTQTRINEYYNALVRHNFTLSGVMTFFTDGMGEEDKSKLAEGVKEAYGGEKNGGKMLFQFLSSTSTANLGAQYTPLSANDLDKQYVEVSKATTRAIYSAFRAVPALFGLMTETTGFSQQEFQEAFDLYSTTMITPRQADIVAIFSGIFNVDKPFTIIPLNFGQNGSI